MSDHDAADAGTTAGEGESAAESAPDDAGAAEDAVDPLVARVAALDEELAAEVEALEERESELAAALEEREAEVDDLEARLARARADFQNYKKRAKRREEELKERATADLVERLLDVRDNLVRALEQDEDTDIRDGVEATLATFDRILEDENVAAIEPAPGDEVDPEVHEVVLRDEDGDQPPGTVEAVYRPGYEQAGTVLRPAQVTVSDDDGA